MEENPHRPRCKKRAHKALSASRSGSPPPPPAPSSSSSKDLGRFTRAPEPGECSVDCSGQSCGSCSAALVADCVALCCCPLAFISLLGLAFIKVPCAMGRRCLGSQKRKKEKRRLCVSRKDGIGVRTGRIKENSAGEEEDVREKEGACEGEMVEQTSFCAGFVEADNVLLEMYQVGHLGFGRVSYTGVQPAK